MLKKLTLIHTVNWYDKSVIKPFAEPWLKENPDVEIINIMDDSLLSESLLNGGPTKAVTQRMINYYLAAESTGADVLMCTCTTMGSCTRVARQFIDKPILNIDEPMAKDAVTKGKVIGILATVPTSAPATQALLKMEAEEQKREIVIKTVINEKAFQYLLAGDVDKHNELIYRELEKLQNEVDVIVLGQISLAQIKFDTKVPMLQVGHSGFNYARVLLDSGQEKDQVVAGLPAKTNVKAAPQSQLITSKESYGPTSSRNA
ncbi:MAG: aspartate/glutamate racemase family protein [Cyclobacteriaceae bacterium]